jgi:phthiocerol/phenolphthiocerol synthesis type-I polyketide synthase E
VLAGAEPDIDALQTQLTEAGIVYRRLHTSHAFHSSMMLPILQPFTEVMARVKLNPPKVPYISNLTGTWITDSQATSPEYYAEHLRQPVRFSEGVETLWQEPDRVLLEVGPGRGLATLAMQRADRSKDSIAVASLRHPDEQTPDRQFILQAVGQLWVRGCSIDWDKFYATQRRHRLPLPTYPFDRQRYWLQNGAIEASAETRVTATAPLGAEYPRPELPSEFVAPRNEIEEIIATIWRELLGVKDVGVYDNFFELGGHSLLATQLIARLNEVFPVELSLKQMFERPTIARLAEAITELLIEKIDGLSDDDAQLLL